MYNKVVEVSGVMVEEGNKVQFVVDSTSEIIVGLVQKQIIEGLVQKLSGKEQKTKITINPTGFVHEETYTVEQISDLKVIE